MPLVVKRQNTTSNQPGGVPTPRPAVVSWCSSNGLVSSTRISKSHSVIVVHSQLNAERIEIGVTRFDRRLLLTLQESDSDRTILWSPEQKPLNRC